METAQTKVALQVFLVASATAMVNMVTLAPHVAGGVPQRRILSFNPNGSSVAPACTQTVAKLTRTGTTSTCNRGTLSVVLQIDNFSV